jgi:S1-C subfamily serine protease
VSTSKRTSVARGSVKFRVWLDYGRSRVYLEPIPDQGRIAFDASGILPERTPDGQIVIASIVADTPGARAGIETGDRVISVNGRADWEINDLRELFRKDGSRVDVATDRRGTRTMVGFTTGDLLSRPAP